MASLRTCACRHTQQHLDKTDRSNYGSTMTQHTLGIKTLTFSNEECCERATENVHKKLETGKKYS